MNSPASQPAVEEDLPSLWLGASSLIDLEDPKLRLRVRALTQLSKTEREKALAVYGFVKRMPLTKRVKLRLRTAREVIDSGHGDATDKATLLVAMLRAAGIPARLRYVLVSGDILRGLTTRVRKAARPLAEIWLHGRWLRTDTYIFDAAYMAAARQRLKERGWDYGFGVHVGGAMLWDGYEHSFVGGRATHEDPMVLDDLGVYQDPGEFVDSHAYRALRSRFARLLHWNVLAPAMQRGISRLRDSRPKGAPARGPRRLS
ncbi:transglutaminase-like domain-containing protein [Ramlibacter sp. XY19]|uniref:transglutaminase-like domain-containing protein n=1 Tax=Ramlibacter paludis TaxID=2908000 RepID=UPI0023DBBC65|nr:transglutaminase-like domain-containing protein [Ramlibacter paludis]MCG2594155.1 transglutaminase-like domain-containing protein [Ramlibacter paludis]